MMFWIVTIEALGHGYYGSIKNEAYKTVQILSKNSRSHQKGEGGRIIAP